MARPLVMMSVFYVLGVVLGRYYFSPAFFGVAVLAALGLLAASRLFKWQGSMVSIVPVFLLFLAVGSLACSLAYEHVRGNIRDYSGEYGTLVGKVAEEPLWREGDVVFILEPESFKIRDRTHGVTGRVRVTLSLDPGEEDPLFLGYGEQVSLRGDLYEPQERRNPGGFDYRSFLEHQGVAATFYTSVSGASSLGVSENMSFFQASALSVKERISSALRAYLPEREGNLLVGMLLGERRALDPTVEQFFRASGVSHLLAVSGLHVGLIAAVLWAAWKRFRVKGPLAFLLTVLLLFSYTYLTGLKPATLRALIMIILAAGALQLGRRRDLPTAVSVAALVTLFYNPLLLFTVGFQLSYAATVTILMLAAPLEQKLATLLMGQSLGGHCPGASLDPGTKGLTRGQLMGASKGLHPAQGQALVPGPESGPEPESGPGPGESEDAGLQADTLPDAVFHSELESVTPGTTVKEKLISIIAVTLAAQLGVLPLTAYYFGQVSLLALVTNILVLPVMALVLGIGFFAALLALLFPAAGSLATLASFPLLKYILLVTETIGSLPFSYRQVFPLDAIWIFVYYGLLFFLAGGALRWLSFRVKRGKIKFRAAHILIAFLLLALAVLAVGPALSQKNAGELEVVFLDVGQGDAIYIGTPGGKHIMLDGGGRPPYLGEVEEVGRWVLLPFLAERRVRELDMIIVTHPHEDHFGGFLAVLEEVPARMLVTNAEETENENYLRLLELAKRLDIPREIIQAGDRLVLDQDVTAAVLAPPEILFQGTGSDYNNNSIVLRLKHGNSSVLLTGDAETVAVDHLLQEGNRLKSDILKVPHHGGRVPNLPCLLQVVSPSAAVITVGSNPFGHPHPETIQALQEQGADIYRTDEHGAVIMHSDGERWKVETMLPGPKYCDYEPALSP